MSTYTYYIRVHDYIYPLHHASFYRIASATTVYCKCCQRNRSPMWLAANPQDVACSEKCPCRWAWHMQSIHANVAIFAKEDAAMQHHIVSQTPTHAAKLRYCKEHSQPIAITSGAKSDQDVKRYT